MGRFLPLGSARLLAAAGDAVRHFVFHAKSHQVLEPRFAKRLRGRVLLVHRIGRLYPHVQLHRQAGDTIKAEYDAVHDRATVFVVDWQRCEMLALHPPHLPVGGMGNLRGQVEGKLVALKAEMAGVAITARIEKVQVITWLGFSGETMIPESNRNGASGTVRINDRELVFVKMGQCIYCPLVGKSLPTCRAEIRAWHLVGYAPAWRNLLHGLH